MEKRVAYAPNWEPGAEVVFIAGPYAGMRGIVLSGFALQSPRERQTAYQHR